MFLVTIKRLLGVIVWLTNSIFGPKETLFANLAIYAKQPKLTAIDLISISLIDLYTRVSKPDKRENLIASFIIPNDGRTCMFCFCYTEVREAMNKELLLDILSELGFIPYRGDTNISCT